MHFLPKNLPAEFSCFKLEYWADTPCSWTGSTPWTQHHRYISKWWQKPCCTAQLLYSLYIFFQIVALICAITDFCCFRNKRQGEWKQSYQFFFKKKIPNYNASYSNCPLEITQVSSRIECLMLNYCHFNLLLQAPWTTSSWVSFWTNLFFLPFPLPPADTKALIISKLQN